MSMETRVQSALEDGASSLGGAVTEKLHDVQDATGTYYEKGVARARELESVVQSYVRGKPIQSLLIATGISLGAGLLIGTLIKK
jgi:ElaB/YqjD/DUF883 family membrane-anchored ribosome-binding protein